MEIKSYKKDNFYSYTLGAFPTIELLKNHPEHVLKIYIHYLLINIFYTV